MRTILFYNIVYSYKVSLGIIFRLEHICISSLYLGNLVIKSHCGPSDKDYQTWWLDIILVREQKSVFLQKYIINTHIKSKIYYLQLLCGKIYSESKWTFKIDGDNVGIVTKFHIEASAIPSFD